MHDVPDTRHRDALQLAAFVRHTTEPTLAEVLGNGDARALFDWLQGLGCMQATSRGLVMHELVRDVLVADALWRDRAAATALRRTACRHFYDCLAASRGREQLHHQAEVLYVLRHQPHKQRFFDWSALGAHRVEAAGADDEAIVTRMCSATKATRHCRGCVTGGSGSPTGSGCSAMPTAAATASC